MVIGVQYQVPALALVSNKILKVKNTPPTYTNF